MSEETVDQALVYWLELSKPQSIDGGGWIRAVRLQQNLQGKQLAKKMRVSPARISVLEKDERRGAVTLKMMQRAAQALDCRFVYAFIPRAISQKAKPRIRLDSATLKSSPEQQELELLQAYLDSLSGTASD